MVKNLENVGAANDSVSNKVMCPNATENLTEKKEAENQASFPAKEKESPEVNIQEENTSKKDEAVLFPEDIFEDELATAIDSIYTRPYCDNRGDMEIINPQLKLSYSICPSTPTVSMQKDAIKRLLNIWENAETFSFDHTRHLTHSFEVKQVVLGSDTVSFIGNINKSHEPLVDIQSMLREEWERASLTSLNKNKCQNKGMEIILN